jgi:hypothetical protein
VKALAKKLLLAVIPVALIGLGLVVAEKILRWKNPEYIEEISTDDMNHLHTYSRVYGWKIQKGRHAGGVAINSKGYRGTEYGYRPAPGQTRIVILGDSIAFGSLLTDEETFAARLDAQHDDIEVVNLAVQGYGTDQELIRLEKEGFDHHPGIVILGFCTVNDLYDNASSKYLYDNEYPKPFYVLKDGVLHKRADHVRMSLLKEWAFVLAQKSILYNQVLTWMKINRRDYVRKLADVNIRYPDSREVTWHLIQRMDELCAERGVHFMVLIFPSRETIQSGEDELIREMLAVPLLQGVRMVNLYPEYTARGLAWSNYYTYVRDNTFHLTPAGARMTSEIVFDQLQKAGWAGGVSNGEERLTR